jgi:hypothetical protein
MDSSGKNSFEINIRYTLYFIIICIFIYLLLYTGLSVNKQKQNCKNIRKTHMKIAISSSSIADNTLISDLNIKTAYNCCCSGGFKNDYVDKCALNNCAKYGVRALDFQIFKLNGNPIISASSVNQIKYKEIYNSLPFNDTMLHVKKTFLKDNTLVNRTEPLFLIFRIYSKSKDTYDKVYDSLNNVFGAGNKTGNLIYITTTLNAVTFSQLKNKVVILIQSNTGTNDNTEVQTSLLFRIASLNFNNPSQGYIYRETDLLEMNTCDIQNTTINVIYPNLQTNSHNYDYTTCVKDKNIQFIGLNFQTNDKQLKSFNSPPITNGSQGFGSFAFKKQASFDIKKTCDNINQGILNNMEKDLLNKLKQTMNINNNQLLTNLEDVI